MVITHLEILASQIPIDKIFSFQSQTLLFRFRKNKESFYTIEVFDSLGKNFLFANKLTYGQNFIDSLLAPITNRIIPLNINLIRGQIGSDTLDDNTLGNTIKLTTDIQE